MGEAYQKIREKRLRRQNRPLSTKKLLIRCPECKRENYGPAVISCICVRCGFGYEESKK